MLNTSNYKTMLSANPNTTRTTFSKKIVSEVSFNNIEDFPTTKGIYFIYEKPDLEHPIYIGSTARDFKTRCRQYLQDGNGGESFRGKISALQGCKTTDAITWIKSNCSAKFLVLNDGNHQNQLEQIAIWCFSPKLNFILNNFEYHHTNLTQS